MGDSECATCQHVPNLQINHQHSQHQTLSISRATELIKQRTGSLTHEDHENDDEVALHPLSNQVRNFYLFIFKYLFSHLFKYNYQRTKNDYDYDFIPSLFNRIVHTSLSNPITIDLIWSLSQLYIFGVFLENCQLL